MQCPKCHHVQGDHQAECLRCGVIFSRLKDKDATPTRMQPEEPLTDSPTYDEGRFTFLLQTSTEPSRAGIGWRVFLIIVLAWYGLKFSFSAINANLAGSSFFHLINLPFHEAGHIFFSPFGRIITSLGGTLGQLLMPLVCLVVLLFKTRDPFGAAVCLWWFGENFVDIAPYINDARSLSLPLLGGNVGSRSPYGFHDWEFILTELGIAPWDHGLARLSHLSGACLMLLGLVWASLTVWQQYQNLD